MFGQCIGVGCEVDLSAVVGRQVYVGKGLVLSAKPMGGDNLLEIAFETVGTKKVMAANARMEKAE